MTFEEGRRPLDVLEYDIDRAGLGRVDNAIVTGGITAADVGDVGLYSFARFDCDGDRRAKVGRAVTSRVLTAVS